MTPKATPIPFIRLYKSWATQSGALTLALLFILIFFWIFPLSETGVNAVAQEGVSVALVLNAFFGLFFGDWAHDGEDRPGPFVHLTYYLNVLIVSALALSLLVAIILPHS